MVLDSVVAVALTGVPRGSGFLTGQGLRAIVIPVAFLAERRIFFCRGPIVVNVLFGRWLSFVSPGSESLGFHVARNNRLLHVLDFRHLVFYLACERSRESSLHLSREVPERRRGFVGSLSLWLTAIVGLVSRGCCHYRSRD